MNARTRGMGTQPTTEGSPSLTAPRFGLSGGARVFEARWSQKCKWLDCGERIERGDDITRSVGGTVHARHLAVPVADEPPPSGRPYSVIWFGQRVWLCAPRCAPGCLAMTGGVSCSGSAQGPRVAGGERHG
jgi:hypothetical protein